MPAPAIIQFRIIGALTNLNLNRAKIIFVHTRDSPPPLWFPASSQGCLLSSPEPWCNRVCCYWTAISAQHYAPLTSNPSQTSGSLEPGAGVDDAVSRRVLFCTYLWGPLRYLAVPLPSSWVPILVLFLLLLLEYSKSPQTNKQSGKVLPRHSAHTLISIVSTLELLGLFSSYYRRELILQIPSNCNLDRRLLNYGN